MPPTDDIELIDEIEEVETPNFDLAPDDDDTVDAPRFDPRNLSEQDLREAAVLHASRTNEFVPAAFAHKPEAPRQEQAPQREANLPEFPDPEEWATQGYTEKYTVALMARVEQKHQEELNAVRQQLAPAVARGFASNLADDIMEGLPADKREIAVQVARELAPNVMGTILTREAIEMMQGMVMVRALKAEKEAPVVQRQPFTKPFAGETVGASSTIRRSPGVSQDEYNEYVATYRQFHGSAPTPKHMRSKGFIQ